MMHKVWSSTEEVPYCFSMSVKFQGHTAQKNCPIWPKLCVSGLTPVWIHWWLWNVAQSLKQQRRDALLFSKVIHQILRSHSQNITDFDPNWAFPDYRPVAAFKSLRFALFNPATMTYCKSNTQGEISMIYEVTCLHYYSRKCNWKCLPSSGHFFSA